MTLGILNFASISVPPQFPTLLLLLLGAFRAIKSETALPPQAAPLLGSRVNHDATYKLQPTIEMHSRGINAVNCAEFQSYRLAKVRCLCQTRHAKEKKKKKKLLVAAAWNRQRAEVENVVVNGVQVVKTKGGDGVG